MHDIYQGQNYQNQAYQRQDDVKVAVYEAHLISAEAQRQTVQDIIAFALVGLSVLVAYWVG